MEQPPTSRSGRFVAERDREQRALHARLREAGRRPPAENLVAGLALIRTAQEFRAAFAKPTRR